VRRGASTGRASTVNSQRSTGTALPRSHSLLIIALAGSAVIRPAAAQAHRATGIEIGTVLGYGRAELTGQDSSLRQRGGVYFGFLVAIPVAGPIGLEPQMILTRKGGELGAAFPRPGVLADEVYLEAPALLRLRVGLGRVALRAFGGAAPALRLGCEVLNLVPSDSTPPTCGQAEATGPDFDLGIVYGGGMDLRLGGLNLRADARLVDGRRSAGPPGSGRVIRNRQWVGALGFSF
jgi:hypothetical protein